MELAENIKHEMRTALWSFMPGFPALELCGGVFFAAFLDNGSLLIVTAAAFARPRSGFWACMINTVHQSDVWAYKIQTINNVF